MNTLGRHAVPPRAPTLLTALLTVLALLLVGACSRPLAGQPTPGQAPAPTVSPPNPLAPRSAPPPSYETVPPRPGEQPPPPDAWKACQLMSWKAFDERVWPTKDPWLPPDADNRPDPTKLPPRIAHVTTGLVGARICLLENNEAYLTQPSQPDTGPRYFSVKLVLAANLPTHAETTPIAGRRTTLTEQPDYHQCTLVVELTDLKLGAEVINTRFSGEGLETCSLARKAAEWAVAPH